MATPDSADPLDPTGAGHLPVQSELLLEALPWGVLVLAADGSVVYLNAAAAAFWGVAASSVLGRQPATVLPAVLPGDLVQALRHGPTEPADYWLPHTQQWISLRAAPAPAGQHWVFWDNVTARKQAEQTLRPQRELLQHTIDSSLDLVQVFEAVRDEQGALLDFRWVLNNAAAERVYGDVIGQRLCQLNPGVVAEGIFDTFKRVLETGVPDQSERHYQHEQFNGWFTQSVVKLNDGVTTTTHDITARKQAEQALRETTKLLQATLDSSHYVVQAFKAVRDARGQIIDFTWILTNQVWKQLYGGPMAGKSLLRENPGVVETGLFEKFVQVTETGVPIDHEQYYAHEQFTGAWFHQTLVRMGDGFVMNTLDITARKQAEQQLRESQHLVQTVFDVSLNPIAYHQAVRDAAGRIIDFEFQLENQEARRYAADDRVGRRFSETYPGIQDTAVFGLYCEVVETGQPLNTEVQLTLKGATYWFHLMAAKLGDGLVATAVDVTERLSAHAEILRLKDELAQQTLDRYYSLFQNIDEGFCIMELIHDEQSQIVDLHYLEANPAFEHHAGFGDVVGKRASELFPQIEPHWLASLALVQQTGVAERVEGYNADTEHWFTLQYSRVGGEGSPLIAAIFNDITEQKLREQQQAFLLALSDALRTEPDVDAVANRALAMLIEHLELDRSYITSYYLAENRADLDYQIGNDSVPPLPDHFVLSDYPEAFKTTFESTVVIEDDWERQGLSEEEKRNSQQLGMRAMVAATLRKEHKPLWSMVAISSRPRRWTPGEIGLVEEVAERTWAAIERARAEDALRASEENYRTLFETMDEGLTIFGVIRDAAGHLVDMRYQALNRALERQTGLDRRTIIGRRLSEVLPPADLQRWLPLVAEAMASGEPVTFEEYVTMLDRWYLVSFIPRGGVELASFYRDITERKRREQHAAFLADISNSLSVLAAPDDIMHTVGERLGRFLGAACIFADVDEARNEATIHHGWNIEGVASLKQTFRLADYFGEEFRRAGRAGEPSIVGDTGNDPLANAEAYAALGIGSFVTMPFQRQGRWVANITVTSRAARAWRPDEIELLQEVAARVFPRIDRVRAEEALRESEAKYRSIFESVDEGFTVQELITDDNDRAIDFIFREANNAFARHTGIQDIVGKRAGELVAPIEPHWLDAMTQAYQTGEPTRTEGYHAALNRWLTLHFARIGGPGSKLVSVVFRNITERKQREQYQAYLLKLNDALRPLRNAVEIQRAAARVIGEYTGVDRAYYVDIEPDFEHWVVADNYVREGVPPLLGHGLVDDFGWAGQELFAGRMLQLSDVNTDPNLSEAARAEFRAVSVAALLAIPIVKEGHWVASFALQHLTPREWSEAEMKLLQETAERTWAAVVRARTEEALRESEDQFRAVANLVPDLLWRSEPDSDTTWYNQQWYEYTGQTPAEAVGYGWTAAIHPDDQAESGRRYRAALLAGKPLRQEHRIRSAQGEYRWFQVQARPVHNAQGEITAWFGAATDIHARKQAELALTASEQRLQALITNLPGAAVFIVDQELRYQLAEGEALRAASYEPADFQGRLVREMAPPGQWSTYRRLYRQALAGRPFEHEHAQGGRTFLTRGVPLPGPGGAVEAVLAVSYDISARKQAEKALRASEVKYRTLFETMDQGFGIGEVIPADEATGRPLDWHWLEVNPQFERLTGLSRAAVLTQTTRQLIPGLEEIWYERYAHVGATGETVSFEAFSPVLDSWFDAYVFAVGPPETRRVAVLFTNTTERRRAEVALREADARHREQLEEQVAARTRELRARRDLLQTVFDTNLIAMSVLEAVRDEAGTIQDLRLRLVSRELERETGRTDLEGKLYAQEYPGIREVGIFDLIVRAVETGEPQGLEYFYPYEGFGKWYACQFVKLDDGVLATNLDVTERKTAEQERLKNLRLLEQAEAVAGLGSWDYEAGTGAMRWSDGMYHLFGLPVGSPAEPSHYLDAVLDDDRPRAEQVLSRLTAGKGFEETLRLRVNGKVKTVRMKAVVLRDEASQPIRVLGVDLDISELQRLEADNLRLRLTQQQALFEAVLDAQEAERKRIAEGLHNGVGQILYATKLQLGQVRAADPALKRTTELLTDAIRQTRAISHELVPMVLNEFGLEPALTDICRTLTSSRLRFNCDIALAELPQPLPASLQLAVYRMAQELVQNIIKHAQATEATLTLETVPGFLLLRAEDNGVGFPAEASGRPGLGLRSLRDRVALLGGTIDMGSAPQVGTFVRLRLPLPPSA